MLAVALTVLAATGVWLWFRYVPTAEAAWPGLRSPRSSEGWIRVTHRVASIATLSLALAAFVLVIGGRIRARQPGIVAGAGMLVTALAASFTGYLLPWDQVALWAVTVGDDFRGVHSTFRSEVKYVLIGSKEISLGTYRFWAISHVVLGLLVAVTVVLAWLRTREPVSRALPPAPEPAPEPEPVA